MAELSRYSDVDRLFTATLNRSVNTGLPMALALVPLLAATGRVRRFNEHVNALLERLPSHKPASTTHFFSQTLDHFGDVRNSGATWRQRCYVDASFWRGPGAPVFLYIGGEGPQGPVSPTLFMHTLAQRHVGGLQLPCDAPVGRVLLECRMQSKQTFRCGVRVQLQAPLDP